MFNGIWIYPKNVDPKNFFYGFFLPEDEFLISYITQVIFFPQRKLCYHNM